MTPAWMCVIVASIFFGFPGYRIGDDGSVWTRRTKHPSISATWKPRTLGTDKDGYKTAILVCADRTKRYFRVHHLVLTAFSGPRPAGLQGCHFPNRNRDDNRICNLRWGTAEENHAHRIVHGTDTRGGRSHLAKLTTTEVMHMAVLYASGKTCRQLAAEFGVTEDTVGVILRGETWKGTPRQLFRRGVDGHRGNHVKGVDHPRAKLTPHKARLIRNLYRGGGYSHRKLADEFGVSGRTIQLIVTNQTWKDAS